MDIYPCAFDALRGTQMKKLLFGVVVSFAAGVGTAGEVVVGNNPGCRQLVDWILKTR